MLRPPGSTPKRPRSAARRRPRAAWSRPPSARTPAGPGLRRRAPAARRLARRPRARRRGKVNVDLIDRNWADILRVAATMAAGTMRPSQILRKLAAYPRQNELATALREVGRIERSLFMIDWTTDPDMRRRAQVGLKQGRGAPCPQKRAINFHQRGELLARPNRGRTALPGRRPQLAGRDHHLLEHAEARRGRLRQEERRPRRPGRIPGPRLAARMGTHQPDRRIPVATCRPTFNVKTLRTVTGITLPRPRRAKQRKRGCAVVKLANLYRSLSLP